MLAFRIVFSKIYIGRLVTMKHLSKIIVFNILVAFFALPCVADKIISGAGSGNIVTTPSGLQYTDIVIGATLVQNKNC